MKVESIAKKSRNIMQKKANQNNGKVSGKQGYSKRTIGQKLADGASGLLGSWHFISFLSIFIVIWVSLNVTGALSSWDNYPFILLNLALSIMAAFTAPVILMSQNRGAERDRRRAINDLATDRSSERKIKDVQQTLIRLEKKLDKMIRSNKENLKS